MWVCLREDRGRERAREYICLYIPCYIYYIYAILDIYLPYLYVCMYVCMYVCIYVYVCIIFYFVLVYLCHCNRFINKLYIKKKNKKNKKIKKTVCCVFSACLTGKYLLFLGYRSLCTFKIARCIVVNCCFCYIFRSIYIHRERIYVYYTCK